MSGVLFLAGYVTAIGVIVLWAAARRLVSEVRRYAPDKEEPSSVD